MIHIIYGAKGSGKTKRIIAAANKRADKSQGVVVYVTDRPEHSLDVNSKARFINIDKYDIRTADGFYGFVRGMVAVNYDVNEIFVDGLARFIGTAPEEMLPVFTELNAISDECGITLTFTLSVVELPEALAKYAA